MVDPFSLTTYIFCKYAGAVGVLDTEGNTVLYAEREGISKLGKDTHVYTNKYKTNKVMTIHSPRALDELSPIRTFVTRKYVVEDAVSGEIIGEITQRMLVNIVNDEWDILSNGNYLGKVRETSLVRHVFHGLFLPRKYFIESANGEIVGTIEELRSLANIKFLMEISDPGVIDTKLLVAVGILFGLLKVRL